MADLVPKSSKYLDSLEIERELKNQESVWLQNFTSKQTQRTYRLAFSEFCALHRLTDSKAFRSVTEVEIIAFRDHLIHGRELSNRSVRNKMAAISSCFRHLQSRGLITRNPADGIERPKVDESVGETPTMTNAQVRKFLQQPDTNTLKGARDSAILHFFCYTGSRVGAPGTIKIKDFYEDRGFYVLKWRKKGGKDQVVPVHPALNEALQQYLRQSEHSSEPDAPLFAPVKRGNNNGEKGLSSKTFWDVWTKYRLEAGLPDQFTPHSARATFATVADENGVPIQDIQTALGHSNISTTQPYIHSRKKHKDSAVFRVNY